MKTKDQDKLQQIWYYMGHYEMIGNTPKAASTSLSFAAEKATSQRERIRAFIGLLTAQTFHTDGKDHSRYRKELLSYAQKTPNPYERGVIYQTIAQYDMNCGNPQQALGFAQASLVTWTHFRSFNDDIINRIGKALLTMAISCRMMEQYTLAQYYAWEAQVQLEKICDSFDLYMAYYEGAVNLHYTGKHEQAELYLVDVLYFFTEHNYPAYIAYAHHSLGLVLTSLGRYQEAEDALLESLSYWQQLGNTVERINVQHAIGYNYMQMNNLDAADNWLKQAMAGVEQIPQQGRREPLQKRLYEDIETLVAMQNRL